MTVRKHHYLPPNGMGIGGFLAPLKWHFIVVMPSQTIDQFYDHPSQTSSHKYSSFDV